MVGASEMATGVVVGSAVIPAPASSPTPHASQVSARWWSRRCRGRHMPGGSRVGGSVGKLPGVAAANCCGLSVTPASSKSRPRSSTWRNVIVKHRPMGSSREGRLAPHSLARHAGQPGGSDSAAGDVRRSRDSKFYNCVRKRIAIGRFRSPLVA